MKLIFLDKLSKNAQMSDLIKIRPVGAELFLAGGRMDRQTDRQTDMTKLIIALLEFCERA